MSESRVLVVMRHAKSSWKTNDPDPRRPLSGRGTRDAVVAGQVLAELDLDVVLCSSAVRTRQTWQCATMGGASCSDVRVLDSLYGAEVEDVLNELAELPDSARTVLVLGHEPTSSELIAHLARPNRLVEQVEIKFATSAIAILGHDRSWSGLTHGSARLVALEVPRG